MSRPRKPSLLKIGFICVKVTWYPHLLPKSFYCVRIWPFIFLDVILYKEIATGKCVCVYKRISEFTPKECVG